MPRTKIINDPDNPNQMIRIPLTPTEETERDVEEAAWTAGAKDRQIETNRQHRNHKLSETDFIPSRQRDQIDNGAVTDLNLANYKLWLTYRQKLRDITNQPDPFSITWPIDPDGENSAP